MYRLIKFGVSGLSSGVSSGFYHGMYGAVHGGLHPKLKQFIKDPERNKLKALQNNAQSFLSKKGDAIKGKLTPGFVTNMRKGSQEFDNKWHSLMQLAQTPLAKPYDFLRSSIDKLHAATTLEQLNFRSRDSDDVVKRYFGDPNVFNTNPNARIDYLKDQFNADGSLNREAQAVKAFCDAIDSQRSQDGGRNRFASCEYKVYNPASGQADKLIFDYTKAIEIYASDPQSDHSIIPECLRMYARKRT
jgi:hypothetical protein